MGLGEGVVVSGRGYEKKRGIKGKIKYKGLYPRFLYFGLASNRLIWYIKIIDYF